MLPIPPPPPSPAAATWLRPSARTCRRCAARPTASASWRRSQSSSEGEGAHKPEEGPEGTFLSIAPGGAVPNGPRRGRNAQACAVPPAGRRKAGHDLGGLPPQPFPLWGPSVPCLPPSTPPHARFVPSPRRQPPFCPRRPPQGRCLWRGAARARARLCRWPQPRWYHPLRSSCSCVALAAAAGAAPAGPQPTRAAARCGAPPSHVCVRAGPTPWHWPPRQYMPPAGPAPAPTPP